LSTKSKKAQKKPSEVNYLLELKVARVHLNSIDTDSLLVLFSAN